MDVTWREHVGKLTLEQLANADACQKHLDDFELQLVATATGQSVIGSVNDVQEMIASFIRSHPAPDASSMKRLAQIHRDAMIGEVVKEILDIAKNESIAEGCMCIDVVLTELKAYKPFMTGIQPREAIEEAFTKQGYAVKIENARRGNASLWRWFVSVSWV